MSSWSTSRRRCRPFLGETGGVCEPGGASEPCSGGATIFCSIEGGNGGCGFGKAGDGCIISSSDSGTFGDGCHGRLFVGGRFIVAATLLVAARVELEGLVDHLAGCTVDALDAFRRINIACLEHLLEGIAVSPLSSPPLAALLRFLLILLRRRSSLLLGLSFGLLLTVGLLEFGHSFQLALQLTYGRDVRLLVVAAAIGRQEGIIPVIIKDGRLF